MSFRYSPISQGQALRLASRLVLALVVLAPLVAGCGGAEEPPPKVLVIGLDGATFDLLDPWIAAGYLPHIAALREAGVSGPLRSVIPYLSPPAWASAATGVNPGRHGIYDFHRLDPDSMVAYFETAKSRRSPSVWALLSDAGRRVGILNIPLTDPPEEVNGFLVAGMPHGDSLGYAYPGEVETELHHEGYRLDRMGEALIEGQEEELEREIFDTFRRRQETALRLGAENPDLDLYWLVFTGTDRIQHFFWKFMEKDHPFHDPALADRFGDSILNLYREIDTAIGELVDQARAQADEQGRELAVIIMSDHGFAGVHRAFRPQSLLRRPPDGKAPITSAYSLESNASMLYIPLKGRERTATLSQAEHDAMVDEVLARILAARDPVSGVSPVLEGGRRETLFQGRYVDKAPDLVFIPRPPYYFINEEGDKEPFGTPAFSFSAHHEMHGILIAAGPMFTRGRLEGGQSLIDIAPTLMYLGGAPVPGYMEGQVLGSLFTPAWSAAHPVVREEGEAPEMDAEELERIRAVPYVQ